MSSQHTIRDNFLAGIFAAVPVVITVILIKWVDDRTQVLSEPLFGMRIPLLGVVIALALVYLLGMAVRSFIGRQALRLIDGLLLRMPVIRPVYEAWKQVSLTPGGKEGMFAKVVMIPVETGNVQMIGFTSGEELPGRPDLCPVFVPNAPNPIVGRLMIARRADLTFLEMTADEALKLIVSNGNYLPAGLRGA